MRARRGQYSGMGSVAGLAVADAVACTILWTGWRIFLPENESPFVPVEGVAMVYFGLGRMLYWSAPVLVGWSMCVLAARQRIRLIWPAVGMAVVASIACMVQVHAQRAARVVRGAGEPGVGGGLDAGGGSWAACLCAALFAVAGLPYAAWRLKESASRRTSVD